MFSILLTIVGGFLVIKYWSYIMKHIKLVLITIAIVFAAIVLIEGARADEVQARALAVTSSLGF